MGKNEVTIAIELLLEGIERVIDGMNQKVVSVLKEDDDEKVTKVIETVKKLKSIRKKVIELQKEWQNLSIGKLPPKISRGGKNSKLKRGLKTPEDKFRIPILESIVELGGRAKVKDVLIRVEEKMRGILNEYDYQGLPSKSSEIRWRNTAKWCRNTLVKEGLLSSDTPRRIWEITPEGREYLEIFRKRKG